MFNVWLGWCDIGIDEDGNPTEEATPWKASCFVLFTHIIYIGEIEADD